jgi:hypothetical protein
MSIQNWTSFIAHREDNFSERIRRHAIGGVNAHTHVIGGRAMSAGIDKGTFPVAIVPRIIKSGGRKRSFAQQNRPADFSRVARMPDMNYARFRSENAQISAGVHDPTAHSGRDQRFSRAINGEPFGDPAQVDNQSATEADTPIAHENNVAPIAFAIPCPDAGQKIPCAQERGDCDIERTVALTR